MQEKDKRYILRMSKKIKAINFLGGECIFCKDKNIFHLSFHHKENDNKEFGISEALSMRWDTIEEELKKCILLCCNCHQEIHGQNSLVKQELLKLKNEFKCKVCGYIGKNNSSLSFHHESGKDFWISTKCNYSRNEFGMPIDKLLAEMKKCIVVCENCHRDIHADIERYNKYKVEIENKILNYKQKSNYKTLISKENDKRRKCDPNLCLKLRRDGKTISEIRELLGYSLLYIEKTLKVNNMSGRLNTPESTQKEITKLWLDGENVKTICEKTGLAWPTIYKYLRLASGVVDKREANKNEANSARKDIVNSYEGGDAISFICRTHRCSKTQIYRVLKKYNVLIPHNKLSIEKIICEYENGKSTEEISRDTNCSHKRICSILRKNGIEIK